MSIILLFISDICHSKKAKEYINDRNVSNGWKYFGAVVVEIISLALAINVLAIPVNLLTESYLIGLPTIIYFPIYFVLASITLMFIAVLLMYFINKIILLISKI